VTGGKGRGTKRHLKEEEWASKNLEKVKKQVPSPKGTNVGGLLGWKKAFVGWSLKEGKEKRKIEKPRKKRKRCTHASPIDELIGQLE